MTPAQTAWGEGLFAKTTQSPSLQLQLQLQLQLYTWGPGLQDDRGDGDLVRISKGHLVAGPGGGLKSPNF